MNKRYSIYYFIAAYLAYTAYRLVKDIREGAPTSTAVNVITVGIFILAAAGVAVYTTVLVLREKRQNKESGHTTDGQPEEADDSEN